MNTNEKQLKCDGYCDKDDGHKGEVITVDVIWEDVPVRFNYCENAIKEDKRRGFEVIPVKENAL